MARRASERLGRDPMRKTLSILYSESERCTVHVMKGWHSDDGLGCLMVRWCVVGGIPMTG